MKNIKKLLALALGASISIGTAFGFVGCGTTEKDPVKDPDTNITNPNTPVKPDPEKPVDPSTPITPVDPDEGKDKEEQAKKELAAAVKTANDAFAALATGKNFTYSAELQYSQATAYFNRTDVKLEQDGKTSYFTQEDGVSYEFTLKDDVWHKNISDTNADLMIESFVMGMTNGFEWKSYDKEANRLYGTKESDDVILQVENDSITMAVNYDAQTGKSDASFVVDNIGTTQVTLPENVIDDTKAPVEVKNVYENGKWNIAVVAKTLEKWLKENIDAFTLVSNDDYKVDKLLYLTIDEETETYNFAFISTYKGREAIEFFNFHKRTIDAFTGYSEISVDQAVEILNNIKSTGKGIIVGTNSISPEYSTLTATPEQKAQFDAMTKNIFTELEIDGLDEKNVKLAFKTTRGGVHASASDGYLYSTTWDHYYVVEVDGNLELLKVGVRASTSRNEGEIDNVINHPEYWNINGSPVRTPLQKGNETLYIDEIKEATLEL